VADADDDPEPGDDDPEDDDPDDAEPEVAGADAADCAGAEPERNSVCSEPMIQPAINPNATPATPNAMDSVFTGKP